MVLEAILDYGGPSEALRCTAQGPVDSVGHLIAGFFSEGLLCGSVAILPESYSGPEMDWLYDC